MTADQLLRDVITVLRDVEWTEPGPKCPRCGAFQGDGLGHEQFCDLRAQLDVYEAWAAENGLLTPKTLAQQEAHDAALEDVFLRDAPTRPWLTR